jgi:hypothetical protein
MEEEPVKNTKEATLQKLVITFLAVVYMYIFVKMMFL